MIRSLALILVATLSTAATALPVAAADATAYHYDTAITPVYGSQYPIAGHLDLQIFPDGIVRGYYHAAYIKAFVTVTGGRDGDYIWFDIGPSPVDLGLGNGSGKLHFVGTMSGDGTITGQVWPYYAGAYGQAAISGSAGQSQATLVPNTGTMSGNQYRFTAKPTQQSDPTPTP